MRGQETIDLDLAKSLGEGDVIMLDRVLISKKDHTMLRKCVLDLRKLSLAERLNVNVCDFSTDPVQGRDLYAQIFLPRFVFMQAAWREYSNYDGRKGASTV